MYTSPIQKIIEKQRTFIHLHVSDKVSLLHKDKGGTLYIHPDYFDSFIVRLMAAHAKHHNTKE